MQREGQEQMPVSERTAVAQLLQQKVLPALLALKEEQVQLVELVRLVQLEVQDLRGRWDYPVLGDRPDPPEPQEPKAR